MKSYTYRPPRIQRVPEKATISFTQQFRRYIFGFGVTLLGIGVGISTLRPHELVEVVIADNASSSAILGVHDSTTVSSSPLSHVKPFLKGSSNWKLQTASIPQQAVGGSGSLLKDVYGTKASISVNFETGEIYHSINGSKRLPLASITKIMTAMVALDLTNPDEHFVVEEPATQVEPTIIGAKVGEKLTTMELIKAGLLTSGNDAMAILAEGVGKKYGGNSDLFIEAMNEKAKLLGLKDTHFANPQGYDDAQHYSNCEDIVVMARYALTNYPQISKIVSEKEEFLAANEFHHSFNLPNWNMLIDTYPGADGIKIGNTGDAGHTTVASATRNGKRVIAVVLGADGILQRDLAAAELLNVGFNKLGISPFYMTEDILRTRIKDWYR